MLGRPAFPAAALIKASNAQRHEPGREGCECVCPSGLSAGDRFPKTLVAGCRGNFRKHDSCCGDDALHGEGSRAEHVPVGGGADRRVRPSNVAGRTVSIRDRIVNTHPDKSFARILSKAG